MPFKLGGKSPQTANASVFKSAAFDVSSSAMMLVDRDLKVQFVNAATVSLLSTHKAAFEKIWPGFNPDAMIGLCIDSFHKNPAHQRSMLADPSRLPHRTDISVGDIKIELNVSAIYDEKGRYVGNTLTWEDVTQRRSNDGVLAALDRGKALIEFSLDGRIITANENFCRTVGYSLSELAGTHHSRLVEPDYGRSEEYRAFWKRLGEGQYQAGKFKRLGKGGRIIWLDASYNPIVDGTGRPFKVIKLADDITETEIQRENFENERAAREEEQKLVVSGLAEALGELSRGNLAYQIRENFPGEYEALKSNFNGSIAQVRDAMQRISQTAEGIRSEAQGINSSSDNLALRTEQQAASLEQTAAALEEVTTTVKNTASASRNASQAVSAAKKDASLAEDVMQQTLTAMGQIETSSNQISNIIGVMEEIAFQTNLLALNAGVEAARAGDAGRGFAVVASEVRALAQRSSDAAKEIKSLISTSTNQISAGGRFVRQAGDALGQIVQKVIEVNALVENIAGSANEQAIALSEVNTAVNQMDQFTQQNAAMVEETTAASHSLSEESQELSRLISQFRLVAGSEHDAQTEKFIREFAPAKSSRKTA
jgi:methyl-accepting chemotaxis protein